MNKIYNNLGVMMKAIVVIFASALILWACNPEPKENKTTNDEVDTTKKTVADQVEKMVYPLPTPFEVTQMLNKAGAGYIYDLCNPTENIEKYFTEKSKAINLGIYGADLSYASTYNKSQKTTQYLASTKKLAEDLGVSTAYGEDVINKIDKYIDNQDTLYNIISGSFYETFDYLNNNEKGEISVLVLGGGWIEGLYISTQLAMISEDNAEVIKGIAGQHISLDKLLVVMDNYKDNEAVNEVMGELNKVKAVFEKAKPDSKNPTITSEQLKEITSIIEALRKSLIE